MAVDDDEGQAAAGARADVEREVRPLAAAPADVRLARAVLDRAAAAAGALAVDRRLFLQTASGKEALVEPDRVSRDEIGMVAAAPSVTPWSLQRERAALRQGGVDSVFATVASLEDTGHAVTRVATSVAEIRDAKAARDTAVVLHFQGSEPLRAGAELAGRSPGLPPGHPADLQLPRCRGRWLLRAGARQAVGQVNRALPGMSGTPFQYAVHESPCRRLCSTPVRTPRPASRC
jgi:hypothetical protein